MAASATAAGRARWSNVELRDRGPGSQSAKRCGHANGYRARYRTGSHSFRFSFPAGVGRDRQGFGAVHKSAGSSFGGESENYGCFGNRLALVILDPNHEVPAGTLANIIDRAFPIDYDDGDFRGQFLGPRGGYPKRGNQQ